MFLFCSPADIFDVDIVPTRCFVGSAPLHVSLNEHGSLDTLYVSLSPFSLSPSNISSTNYQGVYAVEYTTDQPNVCEMAI